MPAPALAVGVGIVALVATGVAVARYESARDAWHVHGAAIGTDAYDAAASDAAYLEVESAMTWVERIARLAAACVVIAGALVGRSRRRAAPPDTLPRPRAWAAHAFDAASLVGVLATHGVALGSPGLTEALSWIVPALLLAVLVAAFASGASLGRRVSARR